MSIEKYAVHVAPRGGKIDLVVDKIADARNAASDKRMEYARSKGAIGLYQNESGVSGLILKDGPGVNGEGATLPDGWQRTLRTMEGIVAAPKAKDRTKAERAAHKTRKTELESLPKLPGAWEFTNEIGSAQVIGGGDGRGFCLLNCWYERVGETTFVMTPWVTKSEETGDLNDDSKVKTAFTPEGCERVGISAYFAAKEAVEKLAATENAKRVA